MMVVRQWRPATGVVALLSGVRTRLTRRPKVPTAAQLAEAAHQAQAATRREEADEVTRAHSRQVMLALWPPRPGSLLATALAGPRRISLPVQADVTRATPPSAAITPYGAGPYWGRFTTCR